MKKDPKLRTVLEDIKHGANKTIDALNTHLPLATDPHGSILKQTDIITKKPIIDARAYGVQGNGDDEAVELQNACNAVPSGGAIVFLPVSCKIDTELTLKSGTVLRGFGNTTVIDGSNCPTTKLIQVHGSLSTTGYALSSNASKGDITLSISSESFSFSPGDILWLYSTGTYCSDPTMSKGEIVEVLSVSGTTITLRNPTEDSYLTTDTATVKRISAVKDVIIENLQILRSKTIPGGANVQGIHFQYAQDCKVDNVLFNECSYYAIGIETSYNIAISRPISRELNTNAADGNTSYGVDVYNGSREILIDGAYIEGRRHCIAIGGSYPSRYVRTKNSWLKGYYNITSPIGHPADCHGGDEIYYENCVLLGGCYTGNGNIVFRNCDLFSNGNDRIVSNRGQTKHYLTFDGCRFYSTGNRGTFWLTDDYSGDCRVLIRNCEVHQLASNTYGHGRIRYRHIKIEGSYFYHHVAVSGSYCEGLEILDAYYFEFKNNFMNGNINGDLPNAKLVNISHNDFDYPYADAIDIQGTSGNKVEQLIIQGNNIREAYDRCVLLRYIQEALVNDNILIKANNDGSNKHGIDVAEVAHINIEGGRIKTVYGTGVYAPTGANVNNMILLGTDLKGCNTAKDLAGVTTSDVAHNLE